MTPTEHIEYLEQRLLQAMRTSDVAELDALLADDLLAVGPDGRLLSKAEDLAAHCTGTLRIEAMVPEERALRLLPDGAVVFVRMAMRGTFQEDPFAGRYCYTRVWRQQHGTAQVIAAHISAVPG